MYNVDPLFTNALDGLVVVDLLAADPRMMARYMGVAGWENFCLVHAASGHHHDAKAQTSN